MRKILTLLVLATFIFGAKAQDLDNSLLWKISGKDLEKPSYLFGTIHMICPDDMVMKDYFESTLTETEQLVLELDMDEPSLMMDMQKYGVNEGMKNISSEMTEKEQKIVNEWFQKNYMAGLQQLGIMKPFLLTAMVIPKYMDCPQPQAYEAVFMQMAQKDSIDILGLETVEQQFAAVDKIPRQKQIEMLIESITDSIKSKEEFNKLVSAYQNQDLNTMYEIGKENPQYADMEGSLLIERNTSWVDPMQALMKQKPTFFAVGALHLSGDDGIINLLRKEGYTVEAVTQ